MIQHAQISLTYTNEGDFILWSISDSVLQCTHY